MKKQKTQIPYLANGQRNCLLRIRFRDNESKLQKIKKLTFEHSICMQPKSVAQSDC